MQLPHEGYDLLGAELPQAAHDDPFRKEIRQWLSHNRPGVRESLDDDKFEFRREWQRTLFEGGWAGPSWPEDAGGRSSTALQQYLYYEELALARVPEPLNKPGIILLGPTLMVHGSKEQQARYLSGILSGEDIWCQGFSEPGAGSDLASLTTRAVRDGDEWVITGQKIWTSYADKSNYCFLLCRTDPEQQRHRGLSLLIVEMDQPSITTRPIVQMSGDSEFSEVFFDESRAPIENTIGAPGEGWAASMTMFQFERADQGFTDHGRLLVLLNDVAKSLAESNDTNELSAADLAAANRELAARWARCQQLRRMNLRRALMIDDGQQIGSEGSVYNLFWGELEKDVAELAAVTLGARGLEWDSHGGHHLLSSRAASIYSGTAEIQRNIIAERLLGLPR